MTDQLPLRPGASGDAVRDLQRRLVAAGFNIGDDGPGTYGAGTEGAVRRFQQARGLRIDGICGRQTWSSLVEAGYRLGDRLLYLKDPMLRGDDVADLQRQLGALGFDAGRVDGIFGPRTVAAAQGFQRNVALTVDGICGPDTIAALRRVTRTGDGTTVAAIREAEALRTAPRQLDGRRVCVGESGGLAALADAVGRALTDAGAIVAVLHHPEDSVQATEANNFGAEAFLALATRTDPGCVAAFYSAQGFESAGGRRLAAVIVDELATVPGAHITRGMRLPLLRETRMPAVVCELGPPSMVVEHTPELTDGLLRALATWVRGPVET